MKQVYVVIADCGGCFIPPHECIVKVFADKDRAEAHREYLLNSPESTTAYEELNAVYVMPYDVE